MRDTADNIGRFDGASTSTENFEPTLTDGYLGLAIVLARRKFFILGLTAAAGVIACIVVLLLPSVYTGKTTILPPQQSQSIAMSMLGQLSPLVTAAAGKDIGLHNSNDLYVAMLNSHTVADQLIDRFKLTEVYRAKFREDARQALASNTFVLAGKDGVISVSVDDHDPRRAADLANSYVMELGRLTQSLAVTDAGKRRLFFEREMKAANEELGKAEEALKQTEEHTGLIQLDGQSRVMMESIARLRAQVSAKEVQVQAMRSYATPENPDLIFAEQELGALRAQVAKSETGDGGRSLSDIALARVPTAGLEYVRRLREVKYRETLLDLLTKQYEAARIDEAKESSIVQVLDPALPPEKRSRPQRASIVVLTTLIAFLLASFGVYAAVKLEQMKEDPASTARLRALKAHLLRGMRA